MAIHLELLRSFDPPSLQALPLTDKRSSLQLKSHRAQREDAAGDQAGDRNSLTLGAEVQPPHAPPTTDHPPSQGTGGAVPHLLGLIQGTPLPPKHAHKQAVRLLHVNPCFCEALSPTTPHLNGTGSCCMAFLNIHARFGEAFNLQKPSLPLHAQVSITSTEATQSLFFPKESMASDQCMICTVQA